jgi:hypothetical protein
MADHAKAKRLAKEHMACNKPQRTPGHPTKSHVVKACSDGKEKIIRFGQQGVSGSPKKQGESESYRKRRESFKARHAKNISKGKMSAAYWADRVKWMILSGIVGADVFWSCLHNVGTTLT